MELTEIKQALLEFRPRLFQAQTLRKGGLTNLMDLFLQQVLGYVPEKEIIKKTVQPCAVNLERAEFDGQIKFLLMPQAGALDDTEAQQAAQCALSQETKLVLLTNGNQFRVYDLDITDGKLEVELLFEMDLTADDPDEAAQTLWTLATKGCGRQVILGV